MSIFARTPGEAAAADRSADKTAARPTLVRMPGMMDSGKPSAAGMAEERGVRRNWAKRRAYGQPH
jgi:hypothetical protein